MGGLPAGTPERPQAGLPAYPAVHDMPPPRQSALLTPEQQRQVELELTAARNKRAKETARSIESGDNAGNSQ